MDITWLGQACFRIKTTHGVVITDPVPPDCGYNMGKQTAHIVTISHKHPDHAFTGGITGEFKVVDRPGEYEISNITIIGMSTYHDNQQGAKSGKNVVFLIETDDISICHLGDLGTSLTTSQIERLQPIDVLMLPVGGFTTIDATQAVNLVRQIEPKIVIPMHYKTPVMSMPAGLDLDTAERFLSEIGHPGLAPQPKFSITHSGLPEAMQVVVLDYPHV